MVEWKAGLVTQQPIMKPANFFNDCTIALDMEVMTAAKIYWRHFEDWAVATTAQHLTTKTIRWIRHNKTGQMIYVRDKM
eukprot:12185491-Karenia_brevis.AAC.1